MEFKKPRRREFIDLQLTAMIDMFSIIIIFLIMGTVFGASDIYLPPELTLPFSGSRDGTESGPRIEVLADHVKLPFLQDAEIPLAEFKNEESELMLRLDQSLQQYQSERAHVQSSSKLVENKKLVLNVIADRATPYEIIFDVSKFFRKRGFETLLFVAMGEQ